MRTILLFLAFSRLLFASPQLDAEYGYRNIATVVTNLDQEPVYGEQVENEVVSILKSSMRFEFSDKGYIYLRDKVHPTRAPQSEDKNQRFIEPVRPYLSTLDSMGVNSVIVGQIIKDANGEYFVDLALATTKKGEVVYSVSEKVINGVSLENFSAATKQAVLEIIKWLPFDSTIIRRDGYLVVLDRGLPVFQKGQQLSAYTVEKRENGVIFEESGVIGLTQVEQNIAFGKILVERRPLEVTVGNKIRLDNKAAFQVSSSLWSTPDRGFASTSSEIFEVTKGRLGVVSAGLGNVIVSYGTVSKTGAEQSMSNMYPEGVLSGEAWLTSRLTLSLQMRYGLAGDKEIGGATKEKVSSSISGFRLLGGYRVNLFAPEPGPIIHIKAGFSKRGFTFNSNQELLFMSTSYSGLLVAGGVTFPVGERWGMGFDIESLIFPGVTEEPFTSGSEISNVSAWDFVMRGYYRYDKSIDFEARLFFEKYGAEFAGAKTRALNYLSSSQTSKGVTLGLSYYF